MAIVLWREGTQADVGKFKQFSSWCDRKIPTLPLWWIVQICLLLYMKQLYNIGEFRVQIYVVFGSAICKHCSSRPRSGFNQITERGSQQKQLWNSKVLQQVTTYIFLNNSQQQPLIYIKLHLLLGNATLDNQGMSQITSYTSTCILSR